VVAQVAAAEVVEGGRTAVIVPRARAVELGRAVAGRVEGAAAGAGPAALDAPVAVLTVADAKGLEFDTVLVVEPGEILAESPRGPSDLYVALTRATRRLGVIHTGRPPEPLANLPQRPQTEI
jgi:superfamily I DNA/RNA helicase